MRPAEMLGRIFRSNRRVHPFPPVPTLPNTSNRATPLGATVQSVGANFLLHNGTLPMNPLKPAAQATVNIAVSTSSQRVQYSAGTPRQSVRIMNDGTATVWVTYGDNTCTASTTTSLPIAAGATEVLTFSGGYVAAIAAGSTGNIYFTPGDGF